MNRACILIVDSQKDVLTDVPSLLQQHRYSCHTVHDEDAASAYFADNNPDLILMDSLMPRLVQAARCQEENVKDNATFIPVLMVDTAHNNQELRRGLQEGVNDFIPTPIVEEDLLTHIQFFLSLKDACTVTEMAWLQLFCRLEALWNTGVPLGEMLDEAMMWVTKTIGAERGSIIFFNENLDEIEQNIIVQRDISSWLLDLVSEVSSSGLAAWVAHHKKGTVVEDTERDPRWLHFPDDPLPVGSSIAVPLVYQDRAIAVLSLVHPEVGFFNTEQIPPLEAVARQVICLIKQ